MKTKLFARILCIILCATIVGAVLLVAIPALSGSAAEYPPVKGGKGVVTDDFVNLRSNAGFSYSIVTVLRKNTRIIFEDDKLYNGDWYKIRELNYNKTGYIKQDYVAAAAPDEKTIILSMRSGTLYAGCQYAFWQKGADDPVWTSSDTSVAVIAQNGVLTAQKAGTVTVTCSEGSNSATCELTVKSASPVSLSANSMTLNKNGVGVLSSSTPGVQWSSSNVNVAVVSGGVVTARATGYATVTAFTDSGASTCLVYVTENTQPQGPDIRICTRTAFTYAGCQYAFWQTGASNPKWTCSDTSVATIDQNGVLTAKSAGFTNVICSEGGSTAVCALTVRSNTSVNLSAYHMTLQKGSSAALTSSTNGVRWFSSNNNVAKVSNGVVTAVGNGYATISAYTDNGAATCLVQVTEQSQSATISLGTRTASTYVGCRYALWQRGASNPSWSTSDASVASVDKNGIVTAKKAGTAVITCSEGSSSATCVFTVKNGSSVNLSVKDMDLILDTTGLLTSSTGGVKWFSSNNNVAKVSNGVVTAVGTGYATISAYTSSGASTCLIQVSGSARMSGVSIGVRSAATYAGCQYAFWQKGASKPEWSSSDTGIATIDQNGILTAKAAGVITIAAREGDMVGTCKVTVKPAAPTGLSLTNITIEKGKTATLTSSTSGVSWFSSNTGVATVENGVVTAKEKGYATISAYTADKASTCLVQVTEAAAPQPSTAKGRVTGGSVNVRSGAGTAYSIVTTVTQGTEFSFLSENLVNGEWYNIKLADGTTGYIIRDYVEKISVPVIKLCTGSATTYAGCQYAFWQTGAAKPLWSSSDTSVATIDQNGILTAKKAGTTVVTVSENGGSATCKVTVKSGTSTGISPTTLTLEKGKTGKLTAKTSGVGWFSSNTNVATVSGGTVTAKAVGYATISAYTSSGASTCLVRVTESTSGTTIRFLTSSASTYVGCQYAIPSTGAAGASWTSSNTATAVVDSNGVVTAKAAGTVTIKATNASSSASFTLKITSGSAPGISSTKETIAAGKSIYLTSNSYVSWFSSNNSVATVNNGIVEAKSEGYVTVSAYTGYGASTCLLHVTAPDSIRFVYASPNCAPKNSTVTFKAITDKTRTGVYFVVSNGSTAYTVDATSKTTDGSNNYIWSGSRTLSLSGTWKVKAFSKTAASSYSSTPGNGEGEVFVTTVSDTTTTVTGERRASDEVIRLIAEFEGFLPTLTGDYITGDPTIGHGKVIWENEQFYNNLTENEAYAYLCQTVNSGSYTTVTNDFLISNNAKFNQRHFDALVCFAYNLGAYALPNDSELINALLSGSSGGSVKAGGSGYINISGVNLRSGAGTGYSILKSMDYNTSFTFVDAVKYNSEWYKIKLTDGTVGYVYYEYATPLGGTKDLAYTDKNAFTQRLLQFHHAAGECYLDLLWRRVDEVEIFFYGDYKNDGEANKYGIYFRCSGNPSFGIG